jgi:hypothetical protein
LYHRGRERETDRQRDRDRGRRRGLRGKSLSQQSITFTVKDAASSPSERTSQERRRRLNAVSGHGFFLVDFDLDGNAYDADFPTKDQVES